MKARKTFAIKRDRAVQIAMSHNCVSREIAERYTTQELREVLRSLRIPVTIIN
jgi:hypothetical protein